ncbi:colanic acid biosynthesis acetyltransferase WcaF [Escherichia coli]|uniref:Colanic acid biosynthesis acetyltransferase WcaF n=1 Tax=Escherichia coli TaxID=562 RepID=A0A2X1KDX6_ECOLX|nr:colanic acid biosynthesis acetyltransferase WcaF [Escherichia coli]
MQDLSGFSVPKGFRGGNAIKVQLWWAVQATIFAWSPTSIVSLAGFFITFIRSKNRKKRSYSSRQ